MIRALKAPDIPGLNSLPPIDWEFDFEAFLMDFFLEEYFYAFVMIQDEKIIGTGNLFLKGKVGWLANIIIADKYRGKGLGCKLTKFLVDFLHEKGCETQLLIATELGEAVYKKIGFRKLTDYRRFDSAIDVEYIHGHSIRTLKQSDLEGLYKLDQAANGEDRAHFIDRYYDTGFGYFNDTNELIGAYLPDFGRGLVLSMDKKAGIELLKLKHSKKGQKTMLPLENKDGIAFLESTGLKEGLKLSRMILGKENDWNPKYIYSYAGGYCG